MVSERKNRIELDLGVASATRLDGDTVTELKELISKLAESKGIVEALEQNDLAGMVTFLESFESPAVESKFILHQVTKAVSELKPESLLRWAMIYMLRNAKIAPEHLHLEILKLLPTKPH